MSDEISQQECFSLANIVPQDPENNRRKWEGVESAVRKLASQRRELYVVTGPIFRGEHLQRIGGAVLVPTHLFKAVYDPQRNEAGAYVVENEGSAQLITMPISELEKMTGINVFPSLEARVKGRTTKLPEPRSYKERKRRGRIVW